MLRLQAGEAGILCFIFSSATDALDGLGQVPPSLCLIWKMGIITLALAHLSCGEAQRKGGRAPGMGSAIQMQGMRMGSNTSLPWD